MRTTALLAADTSIEAERAQVELWRRMSSLEKLRAVTEISRASQQLSLAGIRLRYPEASEQECMLRLAILNLGRQLACQVYPEAARLSGGSLASAVSCSVTIADAPCKAERGDLVD